MQVQFGLGERTDGARPVVLTIGNFDGVHRGHQALLSQLVDDAHSRGADAVVLTFDPHPRCVLDPDNCPQQLTTLDEKRDLLARAGVDRMVVLEFTRTLSRWSADHFCERLLGAFALSRLVVGHDFALGHKRAGDIPFLRAYGERNGFDVVTVDALRDRADVVSSSSVRSALLSGDVRRASRLLGRPYFFDGWVESGEATLHPSVTPGKCLPARGVYATWVRLGEAWSMGATNVGYGMTFGGSRLSIEVLVLDGAGEVERQGLRVAFVERLREERWYPDAESLGVQIAQDVEGVRRVLSRSEAPVSLS